MPLTIRGNRTTPDWIMMVRELRVRLQTSGTTLGQYLVAAFERTGAGAPDCKSQQLFPCPPPFPSGRSSPRRSQRRRQR